MNNNKLVKINGMEVPVGNIRHWRFNPERLVPMMSEEDTLRWQALEMLRLGWESLDAQRILCLLAENFSYGSYWVDESLDLKGYSDYLPGKFETIRKAGSCPDVSIAVLYEGLTLEKFPYAIRLRQGKNTTLLTVGFSGCQISSMYMMDPDIFTYEPTFRKGGIVSAGGEPLAFHHECAQDDIGRPMKAAEVQAFVVEMVANMFSDAKASVESVHTSPYKEFPNIITRSGCDTFYHRIDVSDFQHDGSIDSSELKEFVETARKNGAWPMVMPVSLMSAEGEEGGPLCGGTFFFKILESRCVGE